MIYLDNTHTTVTLNMFSYRVIFELLWRDYFKFVGVKYGNRLFHLKGQQSSFLLIFL